MAINPRSITDVERPWLDAMARDHAGTVERLHAELRARGKSPATILGVTGWLVTKAAGIRDESSQQTKATYRAVLRDVDCPQVAAA